LAVEIQDRVRKFKVRTYDKQDSKYKFIAKFQEHGDLICPKFYTFHPTVGCPFNCGYCYLQCILLEGTHPRQYVNYEDMMVDVTQWLLDHKGQSLKSGSVSDGLASGSTYLKHVIPLFRLQEERKNRLVVLTRAGAGTSRAKLPLKIEPTPSVIFSWTMSPDPIRRLYEADTPTLKARLKLMKQFHEAGWRTRLRIDPIIPVKRSMDYYQDMCQEIMQAWNHGKGLGIDRITLGTLRFNGKLESLSKTMHGPLNQADVFGDLQWCMKREGKRWQLFDSTRLRAYQWIRTNIDPAIPVTLCKETPELSKEFYAGKKRPACDCQD